VFYFKPISLNESHIKVLNWHHSKLWFWRKEQSAWLFFFLQKHVYKIMKISQCTILFYSKLCWVYDCIYLINQKIYYHIFGGIANCEKRLLTAAFLFVCLSICPDLTSRLQVERFLGNSIFDYFPKSVNKSRFIKNW
jgi:hypothetical protein